LAWPFRDDDRAELGLDQIVVGQQQIQKLLLGAACRIGAAGWTDLLHHDHPSVRR